MFATSQNVEGVQVKTIRNGSVREGWVSHEEVGDGGDDKRVVRLTHFISEPSNERTDTALTDNLTVVQERVRVFLKRLKERVCFSSQICDLFVDINVAYVREIDFIFFDQIISEKRKFVDDESVTEPEGSDREDVIQSRIQVAVVDTPFRCEVVICVLSFA